MRAKKFLWLGYKSLIIATVVIIAFRGWALGYDLKEYYPLDQGNSWTYLVRGEEETFEETFTVYGKELVNGTGTMRIGRAEGEYKCLSFDSEGLKEYKDFEKNEYTIFNPPKIIFPDIEIGENKNSSVNSTVYSLDGAEIEQIDYNESILLESIEDVVVVAGKFQNCLKFLTVLEWEMPDTDNRFGMYKTETWLAKDVGIVRRIETATDCHAKDSYGSEMKINAKVEMWELQKAVLGDKRYGQ